MKLLIFTVLAMVGAGFTSVHAETYDAGPAPKYLDAAILDPFELKLNQNVTIPSSNITVRFSNVTSDSRCPSDVTCIWQGEITIQVDVKKENTAFESIILGTDDLIPVFGKYFIQLLKVEPYPQSTHQIQSDEYVVTLAITEIKQDRILPPLQQFRSGITLDEIQCKENFHLVIKASNNSPACVTSATREKLIERGWAN